MNQLISDRGVYRTVPALQTHVSIYYNHNFSAPQTQDFPIFLKFPNISKLQWGSPHWQYLFNLKLHCLIIYHTYSQYLTYKEDNFQSQAYLIMFTLAVHFFG